ncbi:MAG: type II toxin-antitoxin system RelE/ParE family toxin [Flavobacteriales bacterium]|nr:type II toxin-antitoxin system RelE/ParE family toxin [Flavobacteriales bacterium]
MEKRFEVVFLPPASRFVEEEIPMAARKKLLYNIEQAGEKNDPELMKKLDTEIWEIRAVANGVQYRLLAFWDKARKRIVVATHGFVKKTDKVPGREIRRAHDLKREYLSMQ